MNRHRDFHLYSRFGDSIQTVSISKPKLLVSDDLSVALCHVCVVFLVKIQHRESGTN